MPNSQTIEVIYENGVLRPLTAIADIPDRSHLKVTIEAHPLAEFAGILSDREAEDLQRIIAEEFEIVDDGG